MRLSIIVPVYNTPAPLLRECIESIVNSTLERDSYEIVLIDDGSSHDYTDIVCDYSLRYIRTENRGIFRARMLGIEESRGDYITFVDSDDTVSFNYHRPMLEVAMSGVDIVYNDWAFHTACARYYLRHDSTIAGEIDDRDEAVLSRFLLSEGNEHSYSVLWNKVFSGALLRRVGEHLRSIDAPSEFNYSEDTLISFYAHKWAKSVKNLHTGYYFYRIHPSQTVTVNSRERLLSHIGNMSFTLSEMERNVDISDTESIRHIRNYAALMSRTHYSYAKAGGYTDLYDVIKTSYGVNRLEISTFDDGRVYHDTVLLPENFVDRDSRLLELWHTDEEAVVAPTKDEYLARSFASMSDLGKRIRIEEGGATLPAPRIRLTSRILHNPLIYKLGMLLFPKGSPLRALLKRGL